MEMTVQICVSMSRTIMRARDPSRVINREILEKQPIRVCVCVCPGTDGFYFDLRPTVRDFDSSGERYREPGKARNAATAQIL